VVVEDAEAKEEKAVDQMVAEMSAYQQTEEVPAGKYNEKESERLNQ